MRKLFTFLSLLCSLQGMTQLATGDIAIIGVNTTLTATNPAKQSLRFIALRDIPAGISITFTDIAWDNDINDFISTPPEADGSVIWFSPGPSDPNQVTAGEVIEIEGTLSAGLWTTTSATASKGACLVGNDFAWNSALGEQIIACQNPTNNPRFLWGWSTTNWNYSPTLQEVTSDLPPALNYVLANDYGHSTTLGGFDNAYFANGSTAKTTLAMAGRFNSLLKACYNANLFHKNNVGALSFPTYTFEVDNSTNNPDLGGQTFAKWDFTNSLEANGIIGNPVVLLTPLSQSFPNGNVLLTNSYPGTYNSANPAGIMFKASTLGRTGITLAFRMLMRGNAANSIRVEYSIGNTTDWVSVNASPGRINTYFLSDAGAAHPILEMYSSVDRLRFTEQSPAIDDDTRFMIIHVDFDNAIENKPEVFFRIVTASDPNTGAFKALNNNLSYATSADIRFDFVELASVTVLPLTLSNFTATKAGQTTQLNWVTENEVNVDRFEVQKSTNGTAFTTIASVGAKNQATNSYSYTDHQLTEPTAYYRLNMIDKDGSSKYSGVQVVHNTATGNSNVLVSPTLAQNQITVKYNPLAENGVLVITNVQGQKLLTQQLAKGSSAALVGITQLPSGSYFVSVNGKAAVQFVRQ